MRRRVRYLTGLAALLVLAAAPQPGSGQSAGLMTIPAGARAASLAEAVTAAVGGLEVGAYNPASLAPVTGLGVLVSRLDAPDLYRQHFLALGMRRRSGTVLAATVRVARTEPFPLPDGSGLAGGDVSSRAAVVGVSAARTLGEMLDVGASARWVSLAEPTAMSAFEVGRARAGTVAVDLGVIFRPLPRRPVRVGATILDLGPDLESDAFTESLPTRFRFGVTVEPLAWLDPDGDRPVDLLLLADRVVFTDDTESDSDDARFLFGAEAVLFGRVALRGGYGPATSDFRRSYRRLGLGVLFSRAHVDVAYAYPDIPGLDGQTEVTLGLRF